LQATKRHAAQQSIIGVACVVRCEACRQAIDDALVAKLVKSFGLISAESLDVVLPTFATLPSK